MKVKVCFERSKEWLCQQQIAIGSNVPATQEVFVDISSLSEDTRALMFDLGGGSYPSTCSRVVVNASGEPVEDALHARVPSGVAYLAFDGDSPSPTDIDAMFERALTKARLGELHDLRQRLETLSWFLTYVPKDVLDQTVSDIVGCDSEKYRRKIRQQIADACLYTIFPGQ
jgi:hypothetical protein